MAANEKQTRRDGRPINIISNRLIQARGTLRAMAGSYDPVQQAFPIDDEDLHESLWAIVELLDQANDAFNALPDPSAVAA